MARESPREAGVPAETPRTPDRDRRRGTGSAAVLAVICLTAITFLALALAVPLGGLDASDSYAVRHLMPWFTLNQHGTSFLGSLLSYHGRQFHATLGITVPAGAIASSVLVVFLCAVLWRRGDRRGALLWLGAFVVANAVEVLCKSLIARPDLYIQQAGAPYHESGFDSSFPSGHALRGALLTAIIIYTWPGLKWLVLAWVAALVLTLELNGVHTPSDVLGGLLLAFAFIAPVLLLTPKAAAAHRRGRGGRGTVPRLSSDGAQQRAQP